MNEKIDKTPPAENLSGREVYVEIGVGHSPGRSLENHLHDTSDFLEGNRLLVSIDEDPLNLSHVSIGAGSRMTMEDFAENDFLVGKVSKMYIFNVFGDPSSSTSQAGFQEHLMVGLKNKLRPDGMIIIGEHITPNVASFLRDVPRLRGLGFEAELILNPAHIRGTLIDTLGFSDESARRFVQQSEYNRLRKGTKHGGFLLLLKNTPTM